ncbi:hypothetical protein I308_101209 [Cryptococcus tetragattii IND107]|uniref:Uncharacterized protein n=1 Tax=Cryptococcus tetragattii IND107 TaxID=1296105 RepID=A0ABR3C0B9_9TREE
MWVVAEAVKISQLYVVEPSQSIRCILLFGIQRDIKQNCLPDQDWRPSIRAAILSLGMTERCARVDLYMHSTTVHL